MSSRQEEKERRRREREEAERAAAADSARRKRLGIVLGGVLAIAVVGIVIFAVASGGGDDDPGAATGDAAVPARQITGLAEAAEAAGCKVSGHKEEGRGHTSETVKYRTNPPTSGEHDPIAAQDGVYPEPPDVEQSVHALEHGRVLFQYKAGTPAERVSQLETMVGEEVRGTGGYHSLLFENQTEMPHAVAATTWTKSLTCERFTDKTFDALRAFREANVDKAPEQVP